MALEIESIYYGTNPVNVYLGSGDLLYGKVDVSGFPMCMTSNTEGCEYISSITGDSTPTKGYANYYLLFNGNTSWSDGYNLDSGFTLNMVIHFADGVTFNPTSVTTVGPGYSHCIHGRIRIYTPDGTLLAERTSGGTTTISTSSYYSTLTVQFYASSESQVNEVYFSGSLLVNNL